MAKNLNRHSKSLKTLSLDPLLFNICINDFFLFIETTTLCNYAGDNTMYSLDKNANMVINHVFAITSEWFYEKYMVLNADELSPDFSFNNIAIVTEEKILGIVIDNKLISKSDLKIYTKRLYIYTKAKQKLCVLSRISILTTFNPREKNSKFIH